MGHGGINARLKHHLKTASMPHWHIDYLRKKAVVKEIWKCKQNYSREHCWASFLQQSSGALVPVKGFGSSDCNCIAHLFYFKRQPALGTFRKAVKKSFPNDQQIIKGNITWP